MATVPNAAFEASFPVDAAFEHPRGYYFARRLQADLASVTSKVGDFENWRDCGWVVVCEVEGCSFEVYFSPFAADGDSWMIAIAPVGQPGALRKLLGTKGIPYLQQSRALTSGVHNVLVNDPYVKKVRWAMNADPRTSLVTDPNDLRWG